MKQTPLAGVFYSRLILIVIVAIGATFSRAEDRSKIDPNAEKVLVTVGGIDFDIPLGYFYEKTVWAKGAWPVPNKERTTEKGPLVLVAHLDGMKPWSRELSADFGGGRALTTRITIEGSYNPRWLDNFIHSYPSIVQRPDANRIPELIAYGASSTSDNIFYIQDLVPRKPYFSMRCSNRPTIVMCEVLFDYQKTVRVKYLIPVSQLNNWKSTHAEMIELLNKLQTK
jgi:hypothetical protein